MEASADLIDDAADDFVDDAALGEGLRGHLQADGALRQLAAERAAPST